MKYKRIVVNRQRSLEIVEDEAPIPRPGEVRIKMLAAGVSFPDVMMREGLHPEARKPPFTPGWDVVGIVDQLGADVHHVSLGATVAAMPIVGCYAEYLCLPAAEVIPVPPNLDPAETVCLILNYVTAYQMLHRLAQAQPGETALVHGAAGGVGTALLQLAQLAEVKTFGTASTSKLGIVERFGGQPIDYKHCDFLQHIRRSAEGGVDIAFDAVGGWNLIRSWRALRKHGRLIAYGFSSVLAGGKPSLKRTLSTATGCGAAYLLKLLAWNRRCLIYSIQMLQRRKPEWFREDLTTLFGLLERKQLQPLVDRRLPLEQAALAQQVVGKGEAIGKVVLVSQ